MNPRRTDLPPGPRGRWLVGNSYDYDQDRHEFLRRNQAQYGDVFSFSPATVVVCHPELIHEIFHQTNDAFIAESQVLASRKAARRAEINIEHWMRSRKLGWRGLTRNVIRSHGKRVISEFDTMLRAASGEEFDVMPLMIAYTGGLLADFLFGPGSDDLIEGAKIRSRLVLDVMNISVALPRWLPTAQVRRVLKSDEQLKVLIYRRIRSRRAHPHEEPEDLLDLLLAETEAALTDAEIEPLLEGTLLASLGSPAAVLSWMVLELARHPEIRQRIRAEAAELIAQTGSVLDDSQLPYSRAFVKELLRLYPPTWLMGRLVRRPYTLDGWPLRRGQNIMFSLYFVHRDPRWWSDPDELRPERWLSPMPRQARRAYFPFGSGPRVCLGMHLSLYQLTMAAAHLAAYFTIEVNNVDIEAVAAAMLLPAGLRARITPVADTPKAGPTSAVDRLRT